MFDRLVNFVTRTDGNGYWSIQTKTVRINRVELAYVNEEGDFGELRAYFDVGDWNVDVDGLIYSDMGWKHSFLTCMENDSQCIEKQLISNHENYSKNTVPKNTSPSGPV